MFTIAVTDRDWYEYQKRNGFINRINFWTPKVWKVAITPGTNVVFKLKKTNNMFGDEIGGYGRFVEYKTQSLDQSWKEFGRRNGCDTKEEYVAKLTKGKGNAFTVCGCMVLDDVVFFDEFKRLSDYGLSFALNIVTYKNEYSTFPDFGQQKVVSSQSSFSLVIPTKKGKKMQSITERVGQGQFHSDVSTAYNHRCCITGESTPELLQAAHIQDYINKESNHIQNGLLLRIDIHKLFDSGLLYIDQNYHVHVSSLVTSPEYRYLDNHLISLPNNPSEYPSKAALQFKEKSYRK